MNCIQSNMSVGRSVSPLRNLASPLRTSALPAFLCRYKLTNARESEIRGGRRDYATKFALTVALSIALLVSVRPVSGQAPSNDYLFNDTHFHLTNYIQEGADIHDFLKIMGNKAGRVAIFGIPLQQQWFYRVDASEKVRKGNYERIFNEARRRLRNWEAAHVKRVSSVSGG